MNIGKKIAKKKKKEVKSSSILKNQYNQIGFDPGTQEQFRHYKSIISYFKKLRQNKNIVIINAKNSTGHSSFFETPCKIE